jgi:hypothetical protein
MSALFAKPATDTDHASTAAPRDGRDDFDWLAGRWAVSHRKLRKRLAGDTHWDEFAGQCEMRQIVGGLANVDDNLLEQPSGTYRGGALRLFDPVEKLWSIWWIDSRIPGLDTPVRGRFEKGVGTFVAEDSWEGRPIVVRFIWSEIAERSARWEQAFSTDGGATWETNWIMRFDRVG